MGRVLECPLTELNGMPEGSALYRRWAHEMRRGAPFRPGQRVGVAVSGGPDSILLLHFMRQYARESALRLAAVHFNHKLRGEESQGDERLVRDLAAEMHIEFLRSEPGNAEPPANRNLEAAARDLRYRFFFSLLNRGALDKIVTGHTADDQAETVLLRLLRGSGTRGLGGIYPALGGKILRPFLGIAREEIERELQERKLAFRSDSSNLQLRFQRNKIRLELLPLLKKQFNPRVSELLAALSERARDDEEVLEQFSHERAQAWRVREGDDEKIPARAFQQFPAAIQRRVLRQMILAVKGDLKSISYRHLETLRRLALANQSGRKLLFPGHLEARKEFDWLIVTARAEAAPARSFRRSAEFPGEVPVPELGSVFRFKLIEAAGTGKTYNGPWMAGLDPQKLRGKLTLRNWQAGDRFRPRGSQKIRKLKDLMARQKIPAGRRKWWPVLESGAEIVWVRGFPPAACAAATAESKQIVVIEETIEPAR
jgi:tRNA(Ile)-lysidine synthase